MPVRMRIEHILDDDDLRVGLEEILVRTRYRVMDAADFTLGALHGDQIVLATVTGSLNAPTASLTLSDPISYFPVFDPSAGNGTLFDGSRPGIYAWDMSTAGVGLGVGDPPNLGDIRNPELYVWNIDPDTATMTFSQQAWDRTATTWIAKDITLFCVLSPTVALVFPNAHSTGGSPAAATAGGTVCQIITLAGTSITSILPLATYSGNHNNNYNYCPEDSGSGDEMIAFMAEPVSDDTAIVAYYDMATQQIWARLVTVIDDHTLSLGARIDLGVRSDPGGLTETLFWMWDRWLKLPDGGWLVPLVKTDAEKTDPAAYASYMAWTYARLRVVSGTLTLDSLEPGPDLYQVGSGDPYQGWTFLPVGAWIDYDHEFLSLVAESSSPWSDDPGGPSAVGLTVVNDDPGDDSLVFNIDVHAPYDSAGVPDLAERYPPYSFDARDRYLPGDTGAGYAPFLWPLIQLFAYPGETDAMLAYGRLGDDLFTGYFLAAVGLPQRYYQLLWGWTIGTE